MTGHVESSVRIRSGGSSFGGRQSNATALKSPFVDDVLTVGVPKDQPRPYNFVSAILSHSFQSIEKKEYSKKVSETKTIGKIQADGQSRRAIVLIYLTTAA